MQQHLSRKVLAAAAILSAVLALFTALTIGDMLSLRAATVYLADDTVARGQLLRNNATQLARALDELETFARAKNLDDLDEADAALAKIEQNIAALQGLLIARDGAFDEATAALVGVRDRQQSLLDRSRQLAARLRATPDAQPDAVMESLDQMSGERDALDQATDQALDQDVAGAAGAIDSSSRTVLILVGTFCVLVVLVLLATLWLLQHQIVQPLTTLSRAANSMIGGDLAQAVAVTSADEIGMLQTSFNTLSATIQQQTQHLTEQVRAAQLAQTEAEAARREIADQLTTIEQQRTVIREISVPILPLSHSAVVVPLVGALEHERLAQVQDRLTQALARSAIRHIILDITGVPVIDSQVAQALLQVIQAARLLGAQAIVVGVRPEVAQELVSTGINTADLVTRSTLQAGIAYALRGA